MTPRLFTPEEDAAIVTQWSVGPLQHLVPTLNRPQESINYRALYLQRKGVLRAADRYVYHRRWSEDEDERLRELLGRRTWRGIARELERSETAIRTRAHLLGARVLENFLTASDVARILGVDIKSVLRLRRARVLRMHRSSVRIGRNVAWRVELEAFEAFLREHPGHYDPRRIEDEPYRRIAREAHRGLLSVREAAAQLGVHYDILLRHLRRGWFPGEHVSVGHGNTGRWVIRAADLTAFRLRRGPAEAARQERGPRPSPRRRSTERTRLSDREAWVRPARLAPTRWERAS